MRLRLSTSATCFAAWLAASGSIYAVSVRETAEILLLAAAVVTASGVLWRAFRGVRATMRHRLGDWFDAANVRANAPLIEALGEVERRTRELVPNGGSSLADKVTRIEFLYYSHAERADAERDELRRLLEEVTALTEEMQARIDEIESRSGYKRFG